MSTAANYPMPSPAPANNDLDHLRLLSIFHYVYAALTALMACFPIIYVVIGIAIATGAAPLDEVEKQFERIEAEQKQKAKERMPAPAVQVDPDNPDAPNDAAVAPNANPVDGAPDDGAPGDGAPGDVAADDDRKRLDADAARFLGVIFAVVGGALALLGWLLAFLVFLAGRKLARHQGRTFCIVIAALCCMMVPVGTVLGVFTLVVLSRQSVQALFDAPEQMRPW